EVHLGWAAKGLGYRINDLLAQEREKQVGEIRDYLTKMYSAAGAGKRIGERIAKLSDAEILELANNLKDGVPVATPVFDGATEEEIRELLELAYPEDHTEALKLTEDKTQAWLIDGRTGEPFERPVTVGY